jgi:hypothetical protein
VVVIDSDSADGTPTAAARAVTCWSSSIPTMLAGALPGRDLATEILYAGDPFGVFYLVGWLAGA